MSSYYTAAQLEAMRKEQLRRQLEEQRRKIREQLESQRRRLSVQLTAAGETANEASLSAAAGFSTAAADTEVSSGVGGDLTLGRIRAALLPREKTEDVSDLSALMTGGTGNEGVRRRIVQCLDTVSQRPILTEEDERALEKLEEFIGSVMEDKSLSDEERLGLVSSRAESFLRAGAVLTEEEKRRLDEEELDYRALCILTGEEPQTLTPLRRRAETARLAQTAEKQTYDGYIMEVITEIMTELGCSAESEGALDGAEGVLFSVTGHPLCQVFVGRDGSGIMFEPVRSSEAVSEDKRRQAARSANTICTMYDRLEELAAERGVILSRVYREEVAAEQIVEQSAVTAARKQHRRRTAAAKLKTMSNE